MIDACDARGGLRNHSDRALWEKMKPFDGGKPVCPPGAGLKHETFVGMNDRNTLNYLMKVRRVGEYSSGY
jgi:hypothetical protein